MHLSERLRWPGILSACLILHGLSGCGGTDSIVLKDRQIEELAYQSERQRESLVELLGETEQLHVQVEGLEAAKQTLTAEVERLQTNLRFTNEQIETATGQGAQTAKMLAKLRGMNESLEESLRKVKEFASQSANELAELRLMRRQFETELQVVKKEKSLLVGSNGDLAAERNQLQEDLVRAHAVIRSLQGGEDLDKVMGLDLEEVRRLENENVALKKRDAELQKKINYLLASSSAGSGQGGQMASSGAIFQDNPEGLWSEVVGLFEARIALARQGEISWDMFDITVAGVVAVFLLLVIWTTIRWVRIRRLCKRVRSLSARIVELEQLQAEGSGVDGVLGGSPKPPRAEPAWTRGRRSPAMRRSGFSAVISSKTQQTPPAESPSKPHSSEPQSSELQPSDPPQEPACVEETADSPQAKVVRVEEVGQEPEGVLPGDLTPEKVLSEETFPEDGLPEEAPTAEAPAEDVLSEECLEESGMPELVGVGVGEPSPRGRPLESRRMIGARTWQEDAQAEAAKSDQVDDLASTQIIPKMSDESTPAVSLPAIEPRIPDKSLDIGTGPESKGESTPEAKKDSGDDDLLDELRSVINQKFDELMK